MELNDQTGWWDDVARAILSTGAIRYVDLTPKEGFFVFKSPGVYLERGQVLGEVVDPIYLEGDGQYTVQIGECKKNYCYIFHNEKLIPRESTHGIVTKEALKNSGFNADAVFDFLSQCKDDVKIISPKEAHLITMDIDWYFKGDLKQEFPTDGEKIYQFLECTSRGKVDDEYLFKYRKQIDQVPEFSLEGLFTVKTTKASFKDVYGFTTLEVGTSKNPKIIDASTAFEEVIDYFVFKQGLKISSSKYWKPISNLLRRVGLLNEKRGKEKSINPITKNFRAFVLKEYESINKKKPLPLKKLKERLEAEVNRQFPDDLRQAEQYYLSEPTIRRLIKSSIKK